MTKLVFVVTVCLLDGIYILLELTQPASPQKQQKLPASSEKDLIFGV